MINNALTKTRKLPASTSDRWHVVHAKWIGGTTKLPFAQTIVSEHDTREAAESEASTRLDSLADRMEGRPPAQRDHFTVRPPRFRSLKSRKNRLRTK